MIGIMYMMGMAAYGEVSFDLLTLPQPQPLTIEEDFLILTFYVFTQHKNIIFEAVNNMISGYSPNSH